jgi:hypothetical protein
MQEGCTACDLKVGESVDWIYVGNAARQRRRWHGVIVDDWNSTRPGHWFVVRWDMSNEGGSYRGPKPDADPAFVPRSPHFVEEQCTELRRCDIAAGLHPATNELPIR